MWGLAEWCNGHLACPGRVETPSLTPTPDWASPRGPALRRRSFASSTFAPGGAPPAALFRGRMMKHLMIGHGLTPEHHRLAIKPSSAESSRQLWPRLRR